MTGTPVANRPYDIWAQIYFLDHGESLGEDFNEFKRNTNLKNNLQENEEARSLLGINEDSVILCISTEGDTDKESYSSIVSQM